MNTFDYLVISAQSKMEKVKGDIKNFFTSERGVSNVVATIIILLIVIIIIVVFWDRLSEWLGDIMDQIFGADIPSEDDI